MSLILFVYTVITWCVIITIFSLHFLTAPFCVLFFKNKQAGYFKTAVFFLKLGLTLVGVRVKASGLEHLPKDQSFIIASNHQSLLDIAALMMVMPHNFHFFAKKELTNVPILGWEMKVMGHIVVDRSSPKQSQKQVNFAKELLLKQISCILLFPEGTRSTTGKMKEFKRGAFVLSADTKVPIVPCYIDGALSIFAKNSKLARPGKITIQFSSAINPSEVNNSGNKREYTIELMNQTKEAIIELEKNR